MFLKVFSNRFCNTMSQTWTIHTAIITPDYLHHLRQEMHWCFRGQREVFALEICVCFMLCKKWLYQPWWISGSWLHFHPKTKLLVKFLPTSQRFISLAIFVIEWRIQVFPVLTYILLLKKLVLNLDSKYEWSHQSCPAVRFFVD